MPALPHHEERHDAGDHHGAGHRHAIGRGQRGGGFEGEHDVEHRDQQQPVDAGDIDLADLALRGAADLHARHEGELHRLLGQRERAADHRLARDDGGDGRQSHHRQQRPVGVEQEERIFQFLRMRQQQRALPEIVEQQRRHHHDQPGDANRPGAEMAHVGVQRFRAGYGEEYRPQREQPRLAMPEHEVDPVDRIDRGQDAKIVGKMRSPAERDDEKPDHHDRTEPGGDHRGAPALHEKQREDDDHAERENERIERRRDQFQAFDGGQHGNRRRDDGVAVEQRRAGHSEQRDEQKIAAHRALQQRHQAQRSALAMIVGAHDQPDVFQGHDDGQRPQHQRHHPDHHGFAERGAGGGGRQALLQRIERTGADIAIDHPDRSQRQRPERRTRRRSYRVFDRQKLRHRSFRGFCGTEAPSRPAIVIGGFAKPRAAERFSVPPQARFNHRASRANRI